MIELLREILLDVFHLTSALAGFWLVTDWLKLRAMAAQGIILPNHTDPLVDARKWAQVGLFGIFAGVAIFMRDRLDAFANGSPFFEWPIFIAWLWVFLALVERSIHRSTRPRMALRAYSTFIFVALFVSALQRGM